MIKKEFIAYTSQVLGDTETGLSGSEIIKYCNFFAVKFDISIPYNSYPFSKVNKKTALQDNLLRFSDEQRAEIILYLCELEKFRNNKKVAELKLLLVYRYATLLKNGDNYHIIDTDYHWLNDYDNAKKPYVSAVELIKTNKYEREVLDNLRLSLELLLHDIFNNKLSLEKQKENIKSLIDSQDIPSGLKNLYNKIINNLIDYQNKNVKHGLLEGDLDFQVKFVFDLITMLMKLFISIKPLS